MMARANSSVPWVSLECAEIDPLWENGIPKAMLIFKSGFGIEAANQLLDAHSMVFLARRRTVTW